MISCRQCGSLNGLNDKFCPQCGFAMTAADVDALRQQAALKVSEGQRLFGEGRINDAFVVAEGVLHGDPDNVPALALKGDCLERKGDVEGALTCYEHVVMIKPDSPLDRIRVAQLRRIAATTPLLVQSKPDRRNSIFAGAAAFVLLLSATSALVLASNKDKQPTSNLALNTPQTQSRPFITPAPVPIIEDNKSKSQPSEPPKTGSTDPANTTDATKPATGTTGAVSRPNEHRAPNSESVGVSTELPNGYSPLNPNVEAVRDSTKTDATANSDPDPKTVKTDPEGSKNETNGHKAVIDIKPSGRDSNPSVGGSRPKENDANEGAALIRVARQHFLAGEYEAAAKAYEKAIRAGVSPASANHRLAQCYVNLNRRSDALNAYQRALAAYLRMVENGTGDKKLVESYMDECRQAIKLLQ